MADTTGLLPPPPELSTGDIESIRVENVMRQVSDLQEDVRRLAEEEALLQEESISQQREADSVGELVRVAVDELAASNLAVQELLRWKEQQESEASQRSYEELEHAIGENKMLELEIAALEEELEGALLQTRQVMDELQGQSDEVTSEKSYIRQLGKMIEDQEVQLQKTRAAAEELKDNEEMAAANERSIQEMRSALEAVGAAIPEAPMTHRTQKLITQRARVHDAASVAATRQLVSPLKRHGSGAPTSRVIDLPLGVLRPLTEKLGSLRAYASKHGISNFAVGVAEGKSELHCEGHFVDLDAFESNIRAAAEQVLSAEGIVTFKDKARAMTYDRAATQMAQLLEPVRPEPTPLAIQSQQGVMGTPIMAAKTAIPASTPSHSNQKLEELLGMHAAYTAKEDQTVDEQQPKSTIHPHVSSTPAVTRGYPAGFTPLSLTKEDDSTTSFVETPAPGGPGSAGSLMAEYFKTTGVTPPPGTSFNNAAAADQPEQGRTAPSAVKFNI